MTGPEQKRIGRRPGFTLIELLVVTGVILVLMTLVVAFVPRTMEQQRVSRAASQLQGWLSLAKHWALRDLAPRGLRLTYDTTQRVTTLYYIEQPDDWKPGGNAFIAVGATPTTWTTATGTSMKGRLVNLLGANPDFSGNFGGAYPATGSSWPVQDGDFLEVGSGSKSQVARIVYDPTATPPIIPTPTSLMTVELRPNPITATNSNNFRVVRAPRVRTGEAPLQLPADTAIDLYPNTQYASQPSPSVTGGYYDILFGPYGGVIANGSSGSDLHLWVVDTTLNSAPKTMVTTPGQQPFDGQELIVTIGLRSGFISVQPVNTFVDPTTNVLDPYSYTRDGRTSGL